MSYHTQICDRYTNICWGMSSLKLGHSQKHADGHFVKMLCVFFFNITTVKVPHLNFLYSRKKKIKNFSILWLLSIVSVLLSSSAWMKQHVNYCLLFAGVLQSEQTADRMSDLRRAFHQNIFIFKSEIFFVMLFPKIELVI